MLVLGFSNIVSAFSEENFMGILYLTTFGIILSVVFTMFALFKTTQITNTRALIKDLSLKRITYKDDIADLRKWFSKFKK